jgi:hypothetical protein
VPGMDDLVVWLRQQLDEDERGALAASPGPWSPDAESHEVVAVDGITVADGFALSGPQLRATVEHIARHDPARVLREVEAKRRIVDEHVHEHATEAPGFGCRVCDWQGSWSGVGDGGWCLTLRLLALPYSDHPGYREEEWKP